MTAWMRRGMRLDIELAVAMEIANLYLMRASKESDKQGALAFNARLWGVVKHISLCTPDLEYRDQLLECAGQTERAGIPVDSLLDTNMRFARMLAGREATQGALKALLENWHGFRRENPKAQFGTWLLDRLDNFGFPATLAA